MKPKKVIVIFVSSTSETAYALKYRKNHPQYHVKILAPALESQLVLLNDSYSCNDYYSLVYQGKRDYYKTNLKKYYDQSATLTTCFRKNFPKIESETINIVDVVQILLQAEFLEVVYAYELFTLIRKKWNPHYFMFPENTKTKTSGWAATHFSAAALIGEFFVPESKLKYFRVKSKEQKNFFPEYFQKILATPKLIVPVVGGAISHMISKQKSILNRKEKQVDFLLFSGGRNLHFNYKLFDLLESASSDLEYSVISAKNGLEDEWLLRNSSINFYPLDNFETKRTRVKFKKSVKKYQITLESLFSKEKVLQKSIPSNVSGKVKKALLQKAKLTLSKYGPKFIRQTILATEVLRRRNPKLLITTHDPGPSALPFVYLAKKRKIPTVVLLHGFHDVNFGANHESDYIAVWGNLLKDRFSKVLKKKENKIITVGYPFLDDIFQSKKAFWQIKKPQVLSFSSISFLLTVYQLDEVAISQFLIDIFQSFSKENLKLKVHIRAHPGQPLSGVKELAELFGISVSVNQHMTIEEYTRKSDIVVSWDTSAIIWAMLFGKPIFYTSPWWGEGYIPVKKYKAAWIPKDATDLARKVKMLQKNPELMYSIRKGQKKMLQDILGVIDGTSAERHIALIKKLAGS